MNLKANWISRESPTVLKICPTPDGKVKQLAVVLVPATQGSLALGLVMKLNTCSPSSALPGTSKLARLKRLNISVRNCKLRFSSIRKFFTIERSTALKLGPVRMFLPDVPRKPGTGGAKAAGLNQRLGVEPPGGIRLTPASKFGRAALSSVAS